MAKTPLDQLLNAITRGTEKEGLAALAEIRNDKKRGPRIIAVLSEVISNNDGWYSTSFRAEAMKVFAEIYPRKAVVLFAEILKRSDPMELGAKKAAIETLGAIPLKPAVSLLAWAADPSNDYVDPSLQKDVSSSLSKNRTRQSSEELTKIAVVMGENTSKHAVAELSKKQTPQTARGLATVLEKGESKEARIAAAQELGKMESPSAARVLRNYIRKEMAREHPSNPEIFAAAVSALGNFKDEKSTFMLARVLRDNDVDHAVRHDAKDALENMGTKRADRLLARFEPTLHKREEEGVNAPGRKQPYPAQPFVAEKERLPKPPFGSREDVPSILAKQNVPPLQEHHAKKKKAGT